MAATKANVQLWTANKIPFEPFDSHPKKAQILDAMRQIENHTKIWFCRRGNEPNYIEIINNPADKNSSSTIGMSPGKSTVNIKGDEMNGYWALHELCHVAGLIHEQSRADSQNFIETYFKTPSPIKLSCYEIPANPQGVVDPYNKDMEILCDSRALTAFDRVSVMQYAKDMGRISKEYPAPSMVWRAHPALPLGADHRRLSADDITGINTLYHANATGWSGPQHLDVSVSTRQRPGVAAFGSRLYAAWSDPKGDIYYASFDGSSWTDQSKIEGVATQTGVALAAYDGCLYAAWNGYHNDGLFYASFKDNQWSWQRKIEGVATKVAPALAAYDGCLYAAWNGYHNDGLFYASFKDDQWSGQRKIEGVATQMSPALAVFNDRLYAAWNGYNNADGLFYASFKDESWSGQTRVATYSATQGSGLAAFFDPYNRANPALYLVWENSADGIWWANSDDNGATWSGQMSTRFGTVAAPTLAVFDDVLYMLWCGGGDDHLWYSSFARAPVVAPLARDERAVPGPVCEIP